MSEETRSYRIPDLTTIYTDLVKELDKRDYFKKHDDLQLRAVVKQDENNQTLMKYSFILTHLMPEQKEEPRLAGFFYAYGIDKRDGRAFWTTVSEEWLYEYTLQLAG